MPDPDPNLTDMATDSPKWRALVASALGDQHARAESLEARYVAVMGHIESLDRRVAVLEERA